MRQDGRKAGEMRPVNVIERFVSSSPDSVLIEVGHTRVLCTTTIEQGVPRWLKGKGQGWVTAEYSLLPRASKERIRRERGSVSGRTQEIQRLIGRSLRGVCDLSALGDRNVTVDCDVLEADGGTRTASVVGGFISLVKALKNCPELENTDKPIIKDWLSAISVGVIAGLPMLDLCYIEDSAADVDMNIVMNHKGEFVEIQGTGEEATFSRDILNELLDLGNKGCQELIEIQKKVLGGALK